jgi:hypothetical protein
MTLGARCGLRHIKLELVAVMRYRRQLLHATKLRRRLLVVEGQDWLLCQSAGRIASAAEGKVGYAQSWLGGLIGRRHPNVAAVALANKNARIVWALLKHERVYQPDYPPSAA